MRNREKKDKPLDSLSLLAIFVCFSLPFFWLFYSKIFGMGNIFVVGKFGVLTPLGLIVTWGIFGIFLYVLLYKASSKY